LNRRQRRRLAHAAKKLQSTGQMSQLPRTTNTAPPAQPLSPPRRSLWKILGIGNLAVLLGIPASLIGIYTLRTQLSVTPSPDTVAGGPVPYTSPFIAINNGLLGLSDVNANCTPNKLVFTNGDIVVAPRMLKTTSDPVRSKLEAGEQFTFLCGRVASLFETASEHVFVIGDPSSSDSKVLRTEFDNSTHRPKLVNGNIPPRKDTHGPFRERSTAKLIPIFQADVRIDIRERASLIWFSSVKSFRFTTKPTDDGKLKWFPASLSDPPIANRGEGLAIILSSDPNDPYFQLSPGKQAPF
jgi:hypothetical protein